MVLSEHLPLLASAPDGIQKLRGLILELAVRGKLVPQNPDDEPAGELLKRIAQERANLETKGLVKKSKAAPLVDKGEQPFSLPEGWQWVRLATIGNIFNGNSINSNEKDSKFRRDDGLPYIATKDVGYGLTPLDYENGVRIPESELNFKMARAGAVFICAEGGSAGKKCGLCDRNVFFGNKLFANETFAGIPPRLVLYIYLSPFFREQFTAVMTGIIGGVSIAKFVDIPIPLPPLAEQHRIVAKVDELMALCDRLEAEQADAASAHARLVETLLGTLTQSTDAADLAANWQRLAEHFDILFTTEASIDALKQAVLRLAVMGKLVRQNPNDEPADVLLQKIATEKLRLIEEGRLKEQKHLSPINDDEKLFELPDGWAWARLQSVIDVRDGTHDSPKDASGPDTYPLVTSKNFINGEIDFDSARRISAPEHFEIAKRSAVEKFDILFSMIGGNLGNQVMVKDDRQFSVKNVALFKYYNKEMTSPFFVKKYMEHLALDLQGRAIGGAQPFVSLGFLRNLVLALPPIEEQHRIVAKTEELMALCDHLKADLINASQRQATLANALIESALEVA